ncbi:HAD family hydrolase [Shewanella saliphila]|uniref:HAD family hydrolase n=1 Tax=Shewanella saliphila TaxID=2282698 RepID=A0ABQ2Q5R7_9GAMM|nr:HAD family hydrolase [Shewanella saliphila]MCL1101342.1 HAD family hydrolase [Shewanella saliphila]GGP50251.1 hypothetical protein GCM10009409_15920 [Shewanella saliphila]
MANVTESRVHEARFTSFGTTFMGPLLSFFSQSLTNNVPDKAPLYFLAREGYWLEQAFQHHLSGANIQRESHYLLVSRAFLFKIMCNDSRSYAYSLKSSFSGAFYDLIRTRFLLSDAQIKHIFDEELTQELVYLPEDKKKIVAILEEHATRIEDIISPSKQAYISYLKSIGVTEQDKLHLVDLGYSGTIQSLLGILLDKDTHGHYLISSNPGEHVIENHNATMQGYLKENVKIGDGYLPLDRSMFLESLLTAPFGQFRGIRFNTFDSSHFDFYYGRKVASQRYFHELEQVMNGALSFCQHAAKHDISFTTDELETMLASYLGKANMVPHAVRHIFDIDDDVTGNGTVNALQFFGLA